MSLVAFQLNQTARLLPLARRLHEQRFFDALLSEKQLHILAHVLLLNNPQVWLHFLEGACVLPDDDEELSALALQVRCLLWEKAIDVMYGKPEALVEDAEPEQPKAADDDYDDDDEEAEESVDKSDGVVVLKLPPHAGAELEPEDEPFREFNKVYHNFEYDRETLKKRRKLEKLDMQLELHKAETPSMPISLGAALSLKHLLGTITERRDDIELNDFELRRLFMDVRKNRSKWANDERIGQEELYEACERVLLDLRGYTEHLTPFLNKVLKREAPNYGLIVKQPMDLNTMMTKLKTLQYGSRQEFLDDLNRIWDNCLLYNADPRHFLRVHAIAMQKRTQKLAPLIPNIVVKHRLELEPEEENGTPAPGGKLLKKGRMRKQETVKQEEEAPVPEASAVATPVPEPHDEHDDDDDENENDDEDEEERVDERDGDQQWRTLTAMLRAHYCAARLALFCNDGLLNMDASAILREPAKMKSFLQFLDNEVVLKSELLDLDEPYLLEYEVASGVPDVAYRGLDDEAQDEMEQQMADRIIAEQLLQSLRFVLPEEGGLNGLYRSNIGEIQHIRQICFKISLIRQMQTQLYMHRTQMRQPEIEPIREVDIDPALRLPNHDPFSAPVQYAAFRKGVAKVAMHTGFESTERLALDTLAQIGVRYMLNLARLMKLHCESTTTNSLGSRDLLLTVLLEHGVEKPDDLYTFVRERAQKHHTKLVDLRQKLSNFLRDLLRPSLELFSEKSFEDNSEQFTTGDFTSELGDDFFGFKELGLDKEFRMLLRLIPVYLLHLRLHSINNTGPVSKVSKYEDLRDYVPRKLTQADVPQQIGILQPFYRALVEKSEAVYVKLQKRKGEPTQLPAPEAFVLVEDDELPQRQRNMRPRLQPTGKIPSLKKKQLLTAFILPDNE